MSLDKYHLNYDSDKGDWYLKKQGADRATKRFDTKEEATKGGVLEKITNSNSSVRIHKMDGTIQEERTYPGSKDPKGSKG